MPALNSFTHANQEQVKAVLDQQTTVDREFFKQLFTFSGILDSMDRIYAEHMPKKLPESIPEIDIPAPQQSLGGGDTPKITHEDTSGLDELIKIATEAKPIVDQALLDICREVS